MLAEDLLSRYKGKAPAVVATTIVSSQMLRHIAESHSATYLETLTGFKWLCQAVNNEDPSWDRFVFAYEQAIGYAVSSKVRDKDGISAAVCVAGLATRLRERGKTLWDQINTLYQKYGVFYSSQWSKVLSGSDAAKTMSDIMLRFRSNPIQKIGGSRVVKTQDLRKHPLADTPPSDVLLYWLEGGERIIVRPSGTEPKIKAYFEVVTHPVGKQGERPERTKIDRLLEEFVAVAKDYGL